MEVLKEKIVKKTNWYAIYTNSKSEKKVDQRLAAAGFESFLPLVEEVNQWSDRKKKVQKPLIKSYVFVNVSKGALSKVLNVPGAVMVLRYLGKPAIIKDFEIENLKILSNHSDALSYVPKFDITKGKMVKVVRGPFNGLYATILNESGKHRVVVSVEALHSFIEVTMPISHVEEYLN